MCFSGEYKLSVVTHTHFEPLSRKKSTHCCGLLFCGTIVAVCEKVNETDSSCWIGCELHRRRSGMKKTKH